MSKVLPKEWAGREIVGILPRREPFLKTLKHELDMPDRFQSCRQARAAIFEFIEIWYNRKRLHSALD